MHTVKSKTLHAQANHGGDRSLIKQFVVAIGVYNFQILSGVTEAEMANIVSGRGAIPVATLDKINATMTGITKLTTRSNLGNTSTSKIKVKPNEELIVELKQLLRQTHISLDDFACRASICRDQFCTWLAGGENRYGWSGTETKVRRGIAAIKSRLPTSIDTNVDSGDIDVRNYVLNFMLARNQDSPKMVVNCHHNA